MKFVKKVVEIIAVMVAALTLAFVVHQITAFLKERARMLRNKLKRHKASAEEVQGHGET